MCDIETAKGLFRTLNQVVAESLEVHFEPKGPNNPGGCTLGYRGRIEQLLNDNILTKKHPTLDSAVGNLPIQKVDRNMLFKVCGLEIMWKTKNPSANDLFRAVRLTYGYAKQHGFYIGENPVDKDAMKQLLPSAAKVHEKKQHQGLPGSP
jgi:hypothetical protein